MRFFIVTVALVAASGIRGISAPQPQQSVWQGVYSTEQAKRGQALYAQECASCHGPSMAGAGEGPALVGAGFVANWDGLTLDDLFEKLQMSMPGNNPGSLAPQQNADILAYMLSLGKFPAGKTELSRSRDSLKQILFTSRKP